MNTNEMPVRRVVLGGGWTLERFQADNGPFLLLSGPRGWRDFGRYTWPRDYEELMAQAKPN